MTSVPENRRLPFGFGAFLYTQFFSAFNDNVHQMAVALYLVQASGAHEGEAGKWQAIVGAAFVLPFILFSAKAGALADRYNKRSVLIAAKASEVFPMLVSFSSTFLPVPWRYYGLVLGVFLMETRAAFFSPAKYGILPEIIPPEKLVRANGILQMATMVAIVSGEACGGIAFHRIDLRGAMGLCLGFSIVGFLAARWIPQGRPVATPARRSPLESLREMSRDRALIVTLLSLATFWMVSALFRMNIPLFGRFALHIGPEQTSFLWALISLGIGAGAAAIAGVKDPDRAMKAVLPGALGMAAAAVAAAFFGRSFLSAALILGGLGFCGGLYLVPQTTLFQARSPEDRRGAYIGLQNILINVFMLVAAGIYFVLTGPLGRDSKQVFLIIGGGLALLGVAQALALPGLVLGRRRPA